MRSGHSRSSRPMSLGAPREETTFPSRGNNIDHINHYKGPIFNNQMCLTWNQVPPYWI